MKKWLENFWYYHKWATIVTVVVAVCLIFGGRWLIPHETKHDLEIALIGTSLYVEDMDKGAVSATGMIHDLDGDGAEQAIFHAMIFNGDNENDSAMYQRLMADLAAGESRVYFMEKDYISFLANEGVLMSLEGEAENGALLLDGITDEAGNVVAVPVTNTALAEEMGFHFPEDIYIGVRPITPTEKDEKGIEQKEENALLFFREFIK